MQPARSAKINLRETQNPLCVYRQNQKRAYFFGAIAKTCALPHASITPHHWADDKDVPKNMESLRKSAMELKTVTNVYELGLPYLNAQTVAKLTDIARTPLRIR